MSTPKPIQHDIVWPGEDRERELDLMILEEDMQSAIEETTAVDRQIDVYALDLDAEPSEAQEGPSTLKGYPCLPPGPPASADPLTARERPTVPAPPELPLDPDSLRVYDKNDVRRAFRAMTEAFWRELGR